MGDDVSKIRREFSWPSTFPLRSAVEAVTNAGFKPEYISSALEAPIGGRLHHALDSYRKVTRNSGSFLDLSGGKSVVGSKRVFCHF